MGLVRFGGLSENGRTLAGIAGFALAAGAAGAVIGGSRAATLTDRRLIVAFGVLMGIAAVPTLGLRMQWVADSGRRRVERERRFFGIPVGLTSWAFEDFVRMGFRVVQRGRSAPVVRLQLELKAGGPPLIVGSCIADGEEPVKMLADAREISKMMAVPLDEALVPL